MVAGGLAGRSGRRTGVRFGVVLAVAAGVLGSGVPALARSAPFAGPVREKAPAGFGHELPGLVEGRSWPVPAARAGEVLVDLDPQDEASERARQLQADGKGLVEVRPESADRGGRFRGELVEPRRERVSGEEFTEFSRRTMEGSKGTLEVFGEPAFQERDGEWVELSPELREVRDPAVVAEAPEMVVPVSFGADESSLVSFELDGAEVVISSPELEVAGGELVDGGVLHREVARDVDLRYSTSTATVKEDLILHSESAPRSFRFWIADPDGVLGEVVETDDGGAVFTGNGESDYGIQIPPPVAYEARDWADAHPFDAGTASMTVTPGDGGFEVQIEVNEVWLKGRSFPVVLDPVVQFTRWPGHEKWPLVEGTKTSCGSGCGGWYNGLSGNHKDGAGTFQGGNRARTYIRWDHKNASTYLPDRASINAASLWLFFESCVGNPTSQSPYADLCTARNDRYDLQVHRMSSAWTPSESLESLIGKTTTAGMAQTSVSARNSWAAWDVAPIVRAWVGAPGTSWAPNWGLQVRNANDHLTNNGGPMFNSSWYHSTIAGRHDPADTGSDSTRPLLHVDYTVNAPGNARSVSASAVPKPDGAAMTAATVSWRTPSSGSEVERYVVQAYRTDAGTHVAGFDREILPTSGCATTTQVCDETYSTTFSGLASGTTYSFVVWAVNAGGTSSVATNNVTLYAPPTLQMLAPAGGTTGSVGEQAQWTLRVQNPNDRALTGLAAIALPVGTVPVPGTGRIGTSPCTFRPVLDGITANQCFYDLDPTAPAVWFGMPSIAANNGLRDFRFDLVTTTGGLTVCEQRAFSVWVPTNQGVARSSTFGSSTNAPRSCDAGLGLESWWSFVERELGPNAIARVNVANGNLVVQHLDGAPVQGEGQLGYVLRRTYNSQAPASIPLSGLNLGSGWSLNIAAAGDLATAGVTADGLVVPVDLSSGVALDLGSLPVGPVTLVDRDGTRHVFRPRSTTVASPLVTAGLDLTNPSGLLGSLTSLDLSLGSLTDALSSLSGRFSGAVNLCVSTTFERPAGVHLSLWRYVAVRPAGTGSQACVPASGTTPIVVGYATMRPDRVRQVFDVSGRLTAMFDRAGNELRYSYGLGGLAVVWEPGACPDATSTATIPVVPAHCRALRFSYSSGAVAVTDPGGRTVTYTRSGPALDQRLVEVVTEDPTGAQLERWQYRYKGDPGTSSCSGPAGVLCAAVPPRSASGGPATTFSHTATVGAPKTTTITERAGAVTTLDYRNVGTATAFTDAVRAGHAIRYASIDAHGRVGRVLEGTLAAPGGTLNALRDTTFGWDTTGCRPRQAGTDHLLCSTSRVTGPVPVGFAPPPGWVTAPTRATQFTYTPWGQVLSRREILGAGAAVTTFGYRTRYQLPNGSVVTHTDTPAGNGTVTASPTGGPPDALYAVSDLITELPPRGNATGADVAAFRTTFTVDAATGVAPGQVGATCGSGNSGLLCEQIAPEGQRSTYTYLSTGQRRSERSPAANAGFDDGSTCAATPPGVPACSTVYTYHDGNDRDLTGTTSAVGWLKAATDPYGRFVAYGHDRAGNVVRAWDRDATARNTETLAGYPGTLANPPPHHLETRYRTGDAATAFARPWRYVTTEIDQNGNTRSWTLDAHGNATASRPPRGNEAATTAFDTTTSYDANDRPTSIEQPLNLGHPSTLAYDAAGNVTESTDANGATRVTRYDPVGRAVESLWTRATWDPATAPATCVESSTITERGSIPAGLALCRSGVTYDGHDQTIRSTDGAGGTTYTRYDQLGRPITDLVLRGDDPATPSTETDHYLRTDRLYDLAGNATTTCPPRQAASGDPCNTSARYASHVSFDPAGRVTSITTHRQTSQPDGTIGTGWETLTTHTGYDLATNTIAVTDPAGHVRTEGRDLNGRTTLTTAPRGSGTVVETRHHHSPSGDLTATETAFAGSTAVAARTAYRYDPAHRVIDVVDAASSTQAAANDNTYLATTGPTPAATKNLRTRHLYDADSNLIGTYDPRAFITSVTDPDPRFLTRVDIDAHGRTTALWTPFYDTTSAAPLDAGPETTECPSPSAGHQPETVPGAPAYPSGIGLCVTRTTYDRVGNPTRVDNPTTVAGPTDRYLTHTWTHDGLLAATEAPNPAAGGSQPARVTIEAHRYDAVGRSTYRTDAVGWTSQTSYSPDGLTLATQAPAGVPANQAESRTTTTYDPAGQPLRTTSHAGAGSPDAITDQTWFADGQLASTTHPVTGPNAGPITTRYRYDKGGRPVQVWSPSASANAANNPTGTPTLFTYTPDGLLASTVEPVDPGTDRRRAQVFTYDAAGRKTTTSTREITGPDPTGPVLVDGGQITTTWSTNGWALNETGRDNTRIDRAFDPAGNLTAVSDTGHDITVEATYFLNGQLRTATTTGTGLDPVTTGFSYHADGLEAARRIGPNPTGANPDQTITATYNDARALTLLTATGWGRTNDTWTITSDPTGRPVQMTDAHGRLTTYDRNPDGTLATRSLHDGPNPTDTLLEAWTYTYDGLDRIATKTRSGTHPGTETYTYDEAGRLTTIDTTPIGYDPNGNRTSYQASTATYRADNAIATATANGHTTHHSYGPTGTLATDGCRTYTHDGFDRLAETTVNGPDCLQTPQVGLRSTYRYDGLDRQTHAATDRITIPGGQTTNLTGLTGTQQLSYAGLTNTTWTAAHSTNSHTARYTTTPGGEPLAVTNGTTYHTLSSDGHGTTTLTADAATVACTIKLDPWGNPQNPTSPDNPCTTGTTPNTRWHNQGHRDTNTGTYQWGNRTYDPTTGTWHQPDNTRGPGAPTDLSIGTDPLLTNRYTYVNGDPINLWDPTGHWGLPTYEEMARQHAARDYKPRVVDATADRRFKSRSIENSIDDAYKRAEGACLATLFMHYESHPTASMIVDSGGANSCLTAAMSIEDGVLTQIAFFELIAQSLEGVIDPLAAAYGADEILGCAQDPELKCAVLAGFELAPNVLAKLDTLRDLLRHTPDVPNTGGLVDDVAMGGRRLPFRDPDRVGGINKVLDDIEAGNPFPYRQDGSVFRNAQGRLPNEPSGYYREYTVPTPGAANRGARRLVVGRNGEVYYTDDHYGTFTQIDPRRYP